MSAVPIDDRTARAPPRVLHVLESAPPVPSGYAARSRWIVAGQRANGIGVPGVLVSSRQSVYGELEVAPIDGVPCRAVPPSARERLLRERLPGPLARPWFVDGAALEHAIVEAGRAHRADVVHVHWSSAIGAAAARAARALERPLVAEVRFDLAGAMGAQTFGGRATWLENLLRRRFERHLADADVVVAASDALGTFLARTFPALAARLHVVPNGIDAGFVARADAARAASVPNARLTLGTTSKMLRYENLEALIDCAADRPDIDVLFVGDGPERERLERLAAPLNARRDGRVRFTGRVPSERVSELLAAIDVFAVPRHDLAITRFASPLKVVEAMAAARPVVASATGDSRALLADGRGALVPPGEPRAFGAAIDRLVADPALRAALGEAARARAIVDYDGATLLGRYRDVYAAASPLARRRRVAVAVSSGRPKR